MADQETKVLIADDSTLFVQSFSYMLSGDPLISIVGVANNGLEAIDLTRKLSPDIITLDIHMPVMNGLDAIEQIMILVLSDDRSEQMAFEALGRGALDILPKPQLLDSNQAEDELFINQIKFLAGIPVVRHMAGVRRLRPQPISTVRAAAEHSVVAIACSTGGPKALKDILERLPASFPACLLIVQHMSPGFGQGLADWLNSSAQLRVRVAVEGDPIEPGVVLLAPDHAHMLVSEAGRITLAKERTVDGHRPSATLLFQSVARRYRSKAVGLVLTGMGSDGADGTTDIQAMGGVVIAQDEKSALLFGMPSAAIQRGTVKFVLSTEMIPVKLLELVGGA